MVARYVDLRREPDLAVAKERLIATAMLLGVEVRSNVSRAGVMLVGDEDKIDVVLHHYDGRDVPFRPYNPDQAGDTEDDI